jgi:hypothetical protein
MRTCAAVEQMAASNLREQYETLRSAALGAGLPIEARSGLALFLRRGMWGWAQAVAPPSMPSAPPRALLTTSTALDEQQTVIHLFAAMAVRTSTWRVYERIAQSAVASSGA